MKDPRFTIITVCYNAQKYIEETIRSVLNQKYSDYEYIIKDGKSSDGTLELVHSLLNPNENICIVSSKDDGIFDAMNEAVSLARGEYVYFLNAGDSFCDSDVLQNVDLYIRQNPKVEIAYGNIILLDNTCRRMRIYGEICSKKIYAVSGDCICHQAMFARRELFDEKRFDLHYRACADREWQFHFIKKKKIFGCMKFTVAIFRVEGFCTSHMAEYEEETLQCVEKNYDRYIVLGYKVIARMKESRILRQVLRLCGRLLFHKPV